MRDPQIDKLIEYYALYATPATAYKQLREEFGENSLTAGQVSKARERYYGEIVKRRKELTAKIPILDPYERFAYLQQIIDGALEGEIVYDNRTGMPVEAKIDRQSALSALKQVYDQTQFKGVVNTEDEDVVKSIVQSAFEDLKAADPTRPHKDILEEIQRELGDKVKPYIAELASTAVN